MSKIKRKPAKIKKEKTINEFDSIVSPQNRIQPGFDYSQLPKNITDEQVYALQEKNFALWVISSGLEVDHNPFDFNHHKYMIPLYMDNSQEIILMKSAQMGATVYELSELLHFTLFNEGVKACLFFPTQDGVTKLSRDRMTPLIASNKQLAEAVEDTDTLGYKRIGDKSALYLQHLGGIASKDSTPFDMISFDEVRLLNPADIDQARERVSHSRYKKVRMVSTAGMPNSDIHRQFLRGTQNFFYSSCGCREGVILSHVFPDCIVERKGETYYRCPRCGYRIRDPQNGHYVSHNPGAPVQSYHISQMLSHFISPAEILDAYRTTQNLKEFFNAKLGIPYVDKENIPVTQEELDCCVNRDCSWGPDKGQVAMGVDQMGGNNHVIIAKRLPGGKKRIIHIEVIERDNPIYFEDGEPITPFKRLYELMREFNVDMCICDALPNYNDAKDFAQAFPRRVFLSTYMKGQRDIVQWGDRAVFKQQVRKGSHKIKFKQTVMLSRYLSIEFVMKQITGGYFEWPHPRALIQEARNEDTGRIEPLYVMEKFFYEHCKSIVRQQQITNEETGQFKMVWVNLGRDPHQVHALNYCNIALERLKSVPIFSVG
jgi:hypothetical protein